MKIITLFLLVALLAGGIYTVGQETGTFTDARNNMIYKTVKIGTQTWFAENLAFKTLQGCYSYENKEGNAKTYGYLYDWQAAKKACPSGWHLPSKDEWSTLSTYLGGESIAGIKIKEAGTGHWHMPVAISTNETGFTALPGGFRNEKGEFYNLGYMCWFWCASEENAEKANHILIYGHTKDVTISYIEKQYGFSVRCIKD
jgi:uncharacterized protein (TIGR02145 family)